MAYTTIDDPSEYFTITLYTGNATDNRAITNTANAGNFQPDWLWYKERDGTSEHRIFDSSRGASKRIEPNNTNEEATDTSNHKSFDSNGFTIGTSGSTNENGKKYVAWQWKCNGGTTTSFNESGNNPGGDRQVNTTAGFSIIDYVGTGAAGTIEHGLGKVPEWIIFKDRSGDGDNWFVYHVTTGNDSSVRLDTNGADGTDSNRFNNTSPTSSVFTVGASGGTNDDANATIAYCFAPIQGFSKFGAYIGNGNTDGPFVYTGFRPAWLLIKETGNTNEWRLFDHKRNIHNPVTTHFESDTGGAETDGGTTHNQYNFLSNGFKVRTSNAGNNRDGGEYIYMTFAEFPIVSSEGVPAPAR